MSPFSTASVTRPAPYSAELAHREPRPTGSDYGYRDDDLEYVAPPQVTLTTIRQAYLYARREFGATPARSLAFAKVAVGRRMGKESWRAVLCTPSAFRMVKRGAA